MTAKRKSTIDDLAHFGGEALFSVPLSTSGLVQPEFDRFMSYARRAYDAGQFTNNGPNVRDLEERLADFHGTSFCVSFCSGFWAIVLTIRALAIAGRREVVMPSLTYRRMADIAAWVPLKPRFCEVDADTLALNRATLASCITDETALIMAVQPIVNCLDMVDVCGFADEAGIPLIFDSVESVYEEVPDGKIGQFGDAECFSLHASKLINGFEGGYITTNNALLAKRLRSQRSFGFEGQDSISEEGGINAKLCEVHAAMALANLDRLEQTVGENRQIYRLYQANLSSIPGLRLVEFDETQRTSFKNIIVEVQTDWPTTRDDLVRILNAEGILARAYYSPPLHQRTMRYPHIAADLPQSDLLATCFISFPCGAHVSEIDVKRVLELLSFLTNKGGEIQTRLKNETTRADA